MAISGIKNSSKCCVPGELLYSEDSGYVAGNGCYEIHNQIRAGLAGFVQISSSKNQNGEDVKIVEICGRFNEKKHILPYKGAIVTARVESLCMHFAKCSILCVDDTYLKEQFSATLKKEDVRNSEKDKVEIFKFVQPGDIILARVIGIGDSQTSFSLSICENELGVTHAIGLDGQIMKPETLSVVKDVNSEYREPRKVAKVCDFNS